MADMNVAQVSKQVAQEAKPVSAKKEFEQIIRSIRKIAASSRAFSGDFIDRLLKETEKSAESKRNWSLAGSFAQTTPVALVAIAWFLGNRDPGELKGIFEFGSKLGEVGNSATNAQQFGYQADEQRIQQTLTQYNTFERNMSALVDSMNAINNQIRQKEMEGN